MSAYSHSACSAQAKLRARARAPAPSSRHSAGERASSAIASASPCTTPASLRPAVDTMRPQLGSTIAAGPPRSRQTTGSPCASASSGALPLESCRLGNSSASWRAIDRADLAVLDPGDPIDRMVDPEIRREPSPDPLGATAAEHREARLDAAVRALARAPSGPGACPSSRRSGRRTGAAAARPGHARALAARRSRGCRSRGAPRSCRDSAPAGPGATARS